MKLYTVKYKHLIERTETAVVEADSEEEAIKKCKDGDTIEDDSLTAPEESLDVRQYRVVTSE